MDHVLAWSGLRSPTRLARLGNEVLAGYALRVFHLRWHAGSLALTQFASIRVMLPLLEEVALTSDESRKMLQVSR
jgi:hypothetical protein